MTREEAKRRVECCRDFLANNYSDMGEPNFTALNMAIEALSEPTKTDTDEMWQEFESQLLREIHTPMTMDYDSSIRMTEMGIKEVLNKWKYRLSEPKTEPTRQKGHNCNEDYADCDQFVCSNCGIELQDWHRVERDEDDGEVSYHEYTFKFCPNCGAEMESE